MNQCVVTIETKSARETKKVARMLAEKIQTSAHAGRAIVIALEGDLGAGKTTFTQGFAEELGVKECVRSPTFVLMKTYELGKWSGARNKKLASRGKWGRARPLPFRFLVHIDCYRLDSPNDLRSLGFLELLKDKDAIILIEWADRIRALLPKVAWRMRLMHGEKENERNIKILNYEC